ncbi:MAG: hypothetical protein RMJ98_09775 [Myxococcales bacterium]|nr:hypothetical protein [Polyangiaceae bacterium]MDW8249577.1 hypothetical protein [Myxococcales bacterium]
MGVRTAEGEAPVGHTASWIGIQFLRGPGQGSFELRVDERLLLRVDAEAPEFASGLASIELDDAPHLARIVTIDLRPVRLFGAILERSVVGVVVDAIGVAASISGTILRQDPTVYRQALAQRAHDLVIFTHGSFDVHPWNPPESHAASVRALVALHREVRPDISVLITSPVDYKGPLDGSRSSPALAAAENRALARENRVAFWALRAAMGGDHAIVTFHAHRMADVDLIHLNEKGGSFLGNRLALALWSNLLRYLTSHPVCTVP